MVFSLPLTPQAADTPRHYAPRLLMLINETGERIYARACRRQR